ANGFRIWLWCRKELLRDNHICRDEDGTAMDGRDEKELRKSPHGLVYDGIFVLYQFFLLLFLHIQDFPVAFKIHQPPLRFHKPYKEIYLVEKEGHTKDKLKHFGA